MFFVVLNKFENIFQHQHEIFGQDFASLQFFDVVERHVCILLGFHRVAGSSVSICIVAFVMGTIT